MEFRPLEITVMSAEDLKNVNLITKMNVYVLISISGDPYATKHKTNVDRDGGTCPRWNHRLRFTVPEAEIGNRSLHFLIRSDRAFGDRDIGDVYVPIRELLDNPAATATAGPERVVDYQVRTCSGKPKGTLKFSYKFGEKFTAPTGNEKPFAAAATATGPEPVMAYPYMGAGGSVAYPAAPAFGYAMAPPDKAGQYPGYAYPAAAAGYGYPPPQGQGGYAQGYGYPQMGYGYPPVQQAQRPKKNNGSKLGLGLGAGILGGLLVGDMLSDVGEMAAYDCDFDF